MALAVADAVERVIRAGRMPIVLGGDCTITLGVVAGLQRVRDEVRLAYFDGDADLNSPDHTGSGILDATGVAICWVLPTPRWPGSGGPAGSARCGLRIATVECADPDSEYQVEQLVVLLQCEVFDRDRAGTQST